MGQKKVKIIASKNQVDIPFILTDYNNIVVKAVLNFSDTVNLMFHTAANAVTLTEDAIKKTSSIRFTGNIDSIKSWGGQANTARLSIKNNLQIGKLNWENVSITENLNSGQFTDGKFGIDLFKGWTIEIDFDQSMIRLYKNLAKKIRGYEKINLIVDNDMLFINADCKIKDSVYSNKFLLHAGYAGAILIDDQFALDKNLGSLLKITGEKSLKDSYGNIVKTKQAILPLFSINKTSLENLPVGFFEGAIGRQTMSVIGGEILKRFNIIISADRKYIYMKPNQFMATPYKSLK